MISERPDHFENLAPGGEISASTPSVPVHGVHELDFIGRVIPFAGRGINLTPAFDRFIAVVDFGVFGIAIGCGVWRIGQQRLGTALEDLAAGGGSGGAGGRVGERLGLGCRKRHGDREGQSGMQWCWQESEIPQG